ncbi:MAG: FG-GAP repeat domain-containing protein [Thermoplasmatota archaeon]
MHEREGPYGKVRRSASMENRSRRGPPRGKETKYRDSGMESKKGSDDKGNGINGERSLTIFLAVLVVVFIVALSSFMIVLISNETSDDAEPSIQINFMGGSTEILVNSTYKGDFSYIELPRDATVASASMSVGGSLPPQKKTYEVGRNPKHLVTGDLDQDGYPDVVTANYNDHTVSVMRNVLGSGFVSAGKFPVGKSPIKVRSDDLNGDGLLDICALAEDSYDVTVMFNDGSMFFDIQDRNLSCGRVPTDLRLVDAEGDGDIDILVSSQNDDSVRFFLNDGRGGFPDQFDLETKGNPLAIATTDIDDDGLSDLVVANGAGSAQVYDDEKGSFVKWYSTVSVYVNLGSLQFMEKNGELRVDKGVSGIELGDINSDGMEDIIMPHLGFKSVSALLSDGSGWYSYGDTDELDDVNYPSIDPLEAHVADFDGDGDLDLAALSKSADSILYYYGDGKGGFEQFTQYYIGLSPTSFAVFDYDLDGDLDIATTDWRGRDAEKASNGTISILTNLRSGVFGTYSLYATGRSPRGLYVEDVDGDGDIDIATANYFASTISILENNGLGWFANPVNYSIGLEPYAVVIEDFDKDGDMDAASADEANFRIVVLESDGRGGFKRDEKPNLIDIGSYPVSLRTGDIDKDGDMDLYTANYAQNTVTLLYNDGSGNFSTMFSNFDTIMLYDEMPYDVFVEDLNGDGLNDILSVNRGDDLDPTDTISVLLNEGEYEYDEIITYQVGKKPTSAVIFDMEGDGDPDIATANMDGDSVSVLRNDGNGVFTRIRDLVVGDRPMYVNVMDYDSDGLPDLLVTNTESNDLWILRNIDGTGFSTVEVLNIGAYPYFIDVADLNGDGRSDIAITSVNTDRVVVLGCYNYPRDVHIDVGATGTFDLSVSGEFRNSETIDITDSLNSYLASNRNGPGDTVRIPIKTICNVEGIVRFSDLYVIYE